VRTGMPHSSTRKTDSWLRQTGIVLAALGAADAFYLWLLKFTRNEAMCVGSHGCLTVNDSLYSEIGGLPVSVLGLMAYLAILGILVFERRSPLGAEYGPLAVFGFSLIGVIFSAYLTYLEFYVIRAVCPFCMASAVIMTLLLVLSVARLRQQNSCSD